MNIDLSEVLSANAWLACHCRALEQEVTRLEKENARLKASLEQAQQQADKVTHVKTSDEGPAN